MIRCAIYTRVSTEDQVREGYSLEVQREYLLDFAKRNGWEVYAPKGQQVYHDDGISGYVLERPALQQMLIDAKQKKFDLVLVYKLDRFSRRLKDLLEMVDQLDAWGVGFKSATEPFETTSSAGRLMLQQLGSFAEFERNRIAERVFPGMVKSIQQGHWHGARYSPYGYRYIKEQKRLEVVPEEAKIVKMIFLMYLSSKSTTQIAGYLYDKGYQTRSGGRFQTSLIGSILKSPFYLGKLVWNRRHYDKRQKTRKGYRFVKNPESAFVIAEGKHEAIIAQEDFDQVQAKLAVNRKGHGHRVSPLAYVLTGVLICAKCGHRYRGSSFVTNHQNRRRKPWYRCSAKQTHNISCKNPAVPAEVIEEAVFGILQELSTHSRMIDKRFDSATLQASVEPDEQAKEALRLLRASLTKNLTKQKKLNDAYLEEDLAKEVYKGQSRQLREEEQTIRGEITQTELQLVERERSKEYLTKLRDLFLNFQDTKRSLTPLDRKDLVRAVFKWVKVEDGKLTDYELYRPFQRLRKEVMTPCRQQAPPQPQDPEALASEQEKSCMSLPTAVR